MTKVDTVQEHLSKSKVKKGANEWCKCTAAHGRHRKLILIDDYTCTKCINRRAPYNETGTIHCNYSPSSLVQNPPSMKYLFFIYIFILEGQYKNAPSDPVYQIEFSPRKHWGKSQFNTYIVLYDPDTVPNCIPYYGLCVREGAHTD